MKGNTYKFYLNFLIKKGISKNKENVHFKQIQLLNIYIITWLCLASLLVLSDTIFSKSPIPSYIGHGSMIFSLLMVYLINSKGYFILAATLMLICGIISFTIFATILTPRIFAEFYLLILPCIALSLFKSKIIPIAILVLSFISFSYIIIEYNPYNTRYPGPALGVFFLSVFLIINHLKLVNRKHEKHLERDKLKLSVQAKKLKELNEFKSHFFINISHDIRTPLTLINAYIKSLKVFNSEEKKLNIIKNQTKQINTIINNVIDLSKTNHNILINNKEKTNIISLLENTYKDFYPLFEKKNISFNIVLTKPEIRVYLDESLFYRAIANLLTNALKFTPKNKAVSISMELSNDLKIKISNAGTGIPQKDLPFIFDRFYQSKNHINKSKGSGIGLAATKTIIEQHGFKIKVLSKERVKTEFIITIPKYLFELKTK